MHIQILRSKLMLGLDQDLVLNLDQVKKDITSGRQFNTDPLPQT